MDDDMMNDDAVDNDTDRSSAQHAASTVASNTTTVIPIHCDYNNNNDDKDDDDDLLPRWTLIEVNGELLPPKEMTLSSSTSTSLECELGCIWLDQDDAGKIVRFLFSLMRYSIFVFSFIFSLSLSLSSPSIQQTLNRYRC
jgi:hypothetical protein